ncbi:MAG: ABC transporter ATP-binding protein [Chelatococcus sp.]|nr:ABC transporter ATP-binding protein [Chelatococcus sp.]
MMALDNVSLDINGNERVVLLGPSGCGKTTLLRCIAGLERPDEGEILFDGMPVFSSSQAVFVPPEKRDISMMFQSYALWPHMTIADNVAFPLENRGIGRAEIATRVDAALTMVACSGLQARYPAQLSGGQQQRVALARAIVANDSVILFDEPLSNVDAKVREQLRVELVALQRRFGFSALYVTHDQVEATAVADRIAVFNSGRLAQIGSPREIYQKPVSAYVAEFVGSSNTLPGSRKEHTDGLLSIATTIGEVHAKAPQHELPSELVRLMFRPEHLRIEHGTAGPGQNRFPATVETAMFLGTSTEYAVLIAGQRFILRSMGHDVFSENEAVAVSIDPAHVLVFPDVT